MWTLYYILFFRWANGSFIHFYTKPFFVFFFLFPFLFVKMGKLCLPRTIPNVSNYQHVQCFLIILELLQSRKKRMMQQSLEHASSCTCICDTEIATILFHSLPNFFLVIFSILDNCWNVFFFLFSKVNCYFWIQSQIV